MLQKNKFLKNMSYADAILSANRIMLEKNKDVFIFGQGVDDPKDITEQHSIFTKILEIIDVLTHQYVKKA